jgi:LysR family transcriptional regulator, glycine cleavage system transcriptional activator
MRRNGKLPPLTSLRVFECVGRLHSFRAAGEELCITQSAVSYHIKSLEKDLGTQLFERRARGVDLTGEGKHYFVFIRETFKALEEASQSLRRQVSSATLRVSVLPSFAVEWLVHRLVSFAAAHPAINVVLEPGLGLSDLSRGDADLAIRYGRGDWPEVASELLVSERLCPIASPLIARSRPEWTSQEIVASTLLQVSKPYEWQLWASAEKADLSAAKLLHLTDYNIVLQAAIDGHGIAMGREFLVRAKLKSGVVERLRSMWIAPEKLGYWLCLPLSRPSGAAMAFSAWLKESARSAALL